MSSAIEQVFDRPSIKRLVNTNYKKFMLTGFIASSIIISSRFNEKVVLDDVDDDKFINCALTAKAKIVSGDSHLLRLKSYKSVKIISSKEFLETLKY